MESHSIGNQGSESRAYTNTITITQKHRVISTIYQQFEREGGGGEGTNFQIKGMKLGLIPAFSNSFLMRAASKTERNAMTVMRVALAPLSHFHRSAITISKGAAQSQFFQKTSARRLQVFSFLLLVIFLTFRINYYYQLKINSQNEEFWHNFFQ